MMRSYYEAEAGESWLERMMLATSDSEGVAERLRMVDAQLRARGVRHEAVLRAMAAVPRHEFVPAQQRLAAYEDRPLPLGHGQTISQPYMVAVMTEALEPTSTDRVLEVGTGSGYQAAVLNRVVADVVTFDWVPELADRARATLERLGIAGVRVMTGDGSLGSPGERFDGIIVTAGAPVVPPALFGQLVEGGRLVIPLGTPRHQVLTVIRRQGQAFREEQREGCVFVPLQGESGW